jgi:DNA-binding response OmpR family regulator
MNPDFGWPVVVLFQSRANDDHRHALARAGLRVEVIRDERVSEATVLSLAPNLIAIEFDSSRGTSAFDLPRRLRANPRMNMIPIIMYAPLLRAEDIEDIARSGLMWLQVGTTDNLKLIAAVRGVLAAASVIHPS